MSPSDDPFTPAVHSAHVWLNAVAERLNTDDRVFVHRVVRAWLHTVRDRIGVVGSAHFTAQLPELWRGIYYEGWVPSHVPTGHHAATFLTQFAHEAAVRREDVPALAAAVTDTLTDLCSVGQLDGIFAVLPAPLRDLLHGTMPRTDSDVVPADGPADRTEMLEHRLRLLGDALAVLARGFEELPSESDEHRRALAAQQAHRILMAEGLTTAGVPG
jgi:uncharacterized protein (DUF2267 family)